MLIDAYMCQLTKNFLSYEVRQQTFLLGLGYKIFEKKLGAITHKDIFRTHLVAMKIYNNVLHTYPHNPWKFQVIWARTFSVKELVIQQHFARPRLQYFL